MKKGVGLAYDVGDWPNVAEKTGAGWFLNWTFTTERKQEAGANYVPLLAYQYNEAHLQAAAEFAADWPGSHWLVGNEPNVIDQDNLTAEEAGTKYGQAVEALLNVDATAKIRIGGVLNSVAFMEDLLDAFPQDLKPEIKGLHWHRYGWGQDAINFNQFRAAVNSMVSSTRTWGAQWDWRCWLTEFGVIGWGTEDLGIGQVVSFIEQTVPWLDDRGFLQRYAWFCWKFNDTFPVRELARPAYQTAYRES